jgi:hypothetical protein
LSPFFLSVALPVLLPSAPFIPVYLLLSSGTVLFRQYHLFRFFAPVVPLPSIPFVPVSPFAPVAPFVPSIPFIPVSPFAPVLPFVPSQYHLYQ